MPRVNHYRKSHKTKSMVSYDLLIKHSPVGDNHLKIFKTFFLKSSKRDRFDLILMPWYLRYFKLWKFPFIRITSTLIFYNVYLKLLHSVVHSEPHQRSLIKSSTKSVNNFLVVNYFAKRFIADIWQVPECASEYICSTVVKKTFLAKRSFFIKLNYKY